MRACCRPIATGIALMPGLPADLPKQISARLQEWTGQRWLVVPSKEPGGPTLVEAREQAKREAEARASATPIVQAVFDAFPGARIVAVRERAPLPDILTDSETPTHDPTETNE